MLAQYARKERLPRLHAMTNREAQQLYDDRVTAWSTACIPCSLAQRRMIVGNHADCIQDRHAVARFRLGIHFDRYIGCWKCGQPLFICNPRSDGPCQKSLLLFQVCWYAMTNDSLASQDILHGVGAPIRSGLSSYTGTAQTSTVNGSTAIDASIIQWFGKKSSFYGHEACNAVQFTYQWLDRLQSLCSN